MRRAAFVLVATLALALPAHALADDRVIATRSVSFIGEQFEITVEVETTQGALVEIDPTATSWAGVEIVRVASQTSAPSGDGTLHRLTLVVAPFQVGELRVSPGIIVTNGVDVQQRSVPAFALRVSPTLAPNAPLELSPLPPATGIGGGESPMLRPALWTASIVGALLFLALLAMAARAITGWIRRPSPVVEELFAPPDLGTAEALIGTDPVKAYRTLGTVIRGELSRRYGFPAVALTTKELQLRMEAEGVERWEARLVSGLLQECDAVIYAGYRPAPERCEADLTTAREIVGAMG